MGLSLLGRTHDELCALDVGRRYLERCRFLTMFTMWSIMMVAMMLPSATPMVMTFATINRKRSEQNAPYVPAAVFLLGYIIIWTSFSVLATTVQFGLTSVRLLSMS